MPMVSRPVCVDGYQLLDGGIVDPVPYRVMEELGYNRNVLILTQPRGYRKKKSGMLPLMRIALLRYPAVASALAERHHCYNNQMEEIDRREAFGESFVIRPPYPLGIGRTESDPEELERVYQVGRREAEIRLKEIKAFLKEGPDSQHS